MKRALAALVAMLAAAAASAQAQNAPSPLADVSIEQKLGAPLPLDATLRDESGRTVALGDYFHRRPVVLAFVYYECPMLCSYVESGTLKAMRALSFSAGREFELVTVSIDPSDLPKIASAKKADFVRQYGRPGAEAGVHFLTGPAESIAAITRAAGLISCLIDGDTSESQTTTSAVASRRAAFRVRSCGSPGPAPTR